MPRLSAAGDFRPPRDSALLIRAVYSSLPLLMRVRRVVRVHVPEEDWAHLDPLRRQRLILSANHPTGTDPLIAMLLARHMGDYFNFVAGRELFEGLYGWLIQRVGVYSIARGMPDRESIQMTRRLLAERDRKVALFPEGETYFHNDLTLPFHSGVTAMGLWALSDLVKLGKEPFLPLVPAAIKYRFVRDPRIELQERLAALEKAAGLQPAEDSTWYQRLVAIGETVVTAIEREYRLPAVEVPLEHRITRLKEHIVEHVSRILDQPAPDGPLPEKMRYLFNAVRAYATEFMEGQSDYDLRLHQRRVEQARPLYADLWRLHDCMAMTGHYVRDHPTCERFGEVLSRLEKEICGRARSWTPVEAHVRIGEPIQLGEWLPQYKTDRRGAVESGTRKLEERVISLLQTLQGSGHPLPPEAGAGGLGEGGTG